MTGLLVIMGSGETAPTMVKPHRSIFDEMTRRMGGERPAVLLDTPYGFQSNADDISARAVSYFAASVGRTVGVVSWRTAPPEGLARERALSALRAAGWVFAGPGSPTYALRQWRDTPIEGALVDVVSRDGVVLLASAAALTLGSHTVPVYEIYKAGFDPHWVPGLNLVEQICGLPAVVIPHYDNAEGGHHDTRYCYLGEDRLSTMERSLSEGSFVLGVDEHTAVLLDADAATATVVGNGGMTIRRAGRSVVYRAGSVVDFASLVSGDAAPAPAGARGVVAPGTRSTADGATAVSADVDSPDVGTDGAGTDGAVSDAADGVSSLRAATDVISARFDAAMARRDVDGCVDAILALEQSILDWSADTLTSDEGDYARARLRTMVGRLGELAIDGTRDPRQVVEPLVEGLLELRRRARDDHDWTTSDWIRDRLGTAGVEVRDTPTGAEWHLT